jgi:hypothetical protein
MCISSSKRSKGGTPSASAPSLPPSATPAEPATPPPVQPRISLGERVAVLAQDCREREVTLGELLERMEGHSVLLLVFLLSLPFCQPVPLTGLATVFGIPLTWLGWCMMLGKELRLPPRLQRISIPRKFFPALLSGTGYMMRWLERHLHGHWNGLLEPRWVRRACGANLFVSSFLLALPVGLPCSNFCPALPVALTAAALLENDGKMLVRAAAATLLNAAYWVFWAILIALYGGAAVETVRTWIREFL